MVCESDCPGGKCKQNQVSTIANCGSHGAATCVIHVLIYGAWVVTRHRVQQRVLVAQGVDLAALETLVLDGVVDPADITMLVGLAALASWRMRTGATGAPVDPAHAPENPAHEPVNSPTMPEFCI